MTEHVPLIQLSYEIEESVVPEAAAEALHAALEAGLDLMAFSASSTVHNLVALLDAEELEIVRQIPAASIGPLTSKTAREAGLNVVVEPEESTLDAMLAAMVNYYRNQ